MRKMKKALVGILAATMLMASALTTAAATTTADSGSKGTSAPASVSPDAIYVRSANAPVQVAGSTVRTSIAGGYCAKKVEGVAITTPLANVKSSLGLKSGETPYIIVYDLSETKSPKAMDSINAAASALGADVVASISVDLGARRNGQFVSLNEGSIGMVVGIPKNAIDPTKTYSMICVQYGGAVTILEDQDADPNTITFEVKAGPAAYSIVAK